MKRWLKRMVAGWVLWRLFGPEPQPSFRPVQGRPHDLVGRTVIVGDKELFVREAGAVDAPPLVLIHGWGDHSSVIYGQMIPRLAEHFRVIAFDNRNSGKSDRIRGRYEIADVADDIAGGLATLGVHSASVFGYSMGGMIAQELARRHPLLVHHLILSGTASYVGSPHGAPVVAAQLGSLIARGADRISRGEVSTLRTKYLQHVGAIAPEHARWYWTESINRDPELYWQAGLAVVRFDSRDWVGRLTMPALVIITCDDQLMPPAAQYDLAAQIKNAEVVELGDARHEAPMTHAERITKEITAFCL